MSTRRSIHDGSEGARRASPGIIPRTKDEARPVGPNTTPITFGAHRGNKWAALYDRPRSDTERATNRRRRLRQTGGALAPNGYSSSAGLTAPLRRSTEIE